VKKGSVFLIGPMGAGKSTIGRQLAKVLRYPFFDSDKEIESRTGVTISWIFEKEGEQGFRSRETKMIDELTQKQNIVLATGGGAILSEQNRRFLSSRGRVIYLSASQQQLIKRTAKDKKRPLLQTDNPQEKIKALLEERDPLYQEIADIIIRTGEQSVQRTVNNVIKQLEKLK
jgi:shikimate kinase